MNATLEQGQQVLKLITDQEPTAEQLQQLIKNGWIIRDLLKMGRDKPDRIKFCQVIGASFIDRLTSSDERIKVDHAAGIAEIIQELKGITADSGLKPHYGEFDQFAYPQPAGMVPLECVAPVFNMPWPVFKDQLEKEGYKHPDVYDFLYFLKVHRVEIMQSPLLLLFLPFEFHLYGPESEPSFLIYHQWQIKLISLTDVRNVDRSISFLVRLPEKKSA